MGALDGPFTFTALASFFLWVFHIMGLPPFKEVALRWLGKPDFKAGSLNHVTSTWLATSNLFAGIVGTIVSTWETQGDDEVLVSYKQDIAVAFGMLYFVLTIENTVFGYFATRSCARLPFFGLALSCFPVALWNTVYAFDTIGARSVGIFSYIVYTLTMLCLLADFLRKLCTHSVPNLKRVPVTDDDDDTVVMEKVPSPTTTAIAKGLNLSSAYEKLM
eukprot:m.131736 g.131736  ORF g.131736 m.131736 type:complete len:218 (-) comp14633_c0_seq13:2607-3260(-)